MQPEEPAEREQQSEGRPQPPTWPTYHLPSVPPAPPSGWPGEAPPYGAQYYGPHYQPPSSPYATPNNLGKPRQRGFLGWLAGLAVAIFAYAKYALALGLKFGVVKTALTLLVSFGAYAWARGPLFAGALVLMILVHEMGHVVEIRRQGMQASAPLFIPFMGAAIFQRSHPTDAFHQALIGIAGPISGTLGASASLILFTITGMDFFLVAAFWGFLLNLFNLIPFGMLDGGWILSAASKWAQVLGLGLLALAVFFLGFSPIILFLVVLGLPTMLERFRNDRLPYYQSVPAGAKFALGGAWLGLVVFLGYMLMQAGAMAGLTQNL